VKHVPRRLESHQLDRFQVSTLDRKKKNFSFSRRFPFMKSREDGKNEDGSDQEREYSHLVTVVPWFLLGI
jgi:hypothetical protein